MDLRRIGRWLWLQRPSQNQIYKYLKTAAFSLFVFLLVFGLVFLALFSETRFMGEPFCTVQDFINALRNSGLIGVIESVSIITGIILFLLSGAHQAKQRGHYEAWFVLDIAEGKETSYARIRALTDLNNDNVPLIGLDAVGADLNNIQLENADLSSASLERASFQMASLKSTRFWYCDLQAADFTLARLEFADFYDANITGAKFEGAYLKGSKFSKATLSNTNFSRSDLRESCFEDNDLQSTIFKDADLHSADFRGSTNIPLLEILKAKNWQRALFSQSTRRQLDALSRAQSTN
ncbi:pentapeptide repeat-containing protein [Leptothoe sp. PORK10 BA2]|uniref:pentapeptide repeat-containing protein n=1 Tax=Leptothoe sp. PORK10 BA2 TaxID=3110254 RepID=UPI002B1EF79D|nr:pentapeptide repeat-containing protein [Leptothoe sp. PORK10 BA2]MEA5464524.1 pentapeptide repeat-containing protein [Leptothoe sp. PORK10 BA2]